MKETGDRSRRLAALGRSFVLVMVLLSALFLGGIVAASALHVLDVVGAGLALAVSTALALALSTILVVGTAFYFRLIHPRLGSLEKSEAENRSIIESVSEGVMTTGPDGTILDVNDAFQAMTGYEREEVVGRRPSILRSDHHDQAFYAAMWGQLLGEGAWRGEIWNRCKTGEALPFLLSIASIHDDRGDLVKYVAVYDDITEFKESEEQIRHAAYHDALTGLPNRVLLTDRLSMALVNAERAGERIALVFMDLDRFKNVNDSLGHAVGDDVLVKVAETLEAGKRHGDTVARWGGDEFVIVVTGIRKPEEAGVVCRRIMTAFSRPLAVGEHEIFVSPSIGVAIYPDDGRDAESLLKSADTALYRAKEEGRIGFKFYTMDFEREASDRLELEMDLRRALEADEFRLHFQPQVRISTGNVFAAEALLRWVHPVRGLIPPSRFIPLAEETGLILEIGDWVMRTACETWKHWSASGVVAPGARIAINVSPLQLMQHDFTDRVQDLLKQMRMSPRLVEFEITEGAILKDSRSTIEKLQTLKDWGVTISLDDFGTGYSSLGYLTRFHVDSLKIDRRFIKNVPEDVDSAAITSAILAMAASLDIDVIAEGVEKPRQLDYLARKGCDRVQGFIYSRPVPAVEFEKLKGRRLAAGP
jgi:diguanylate cyclase (GGDEF)-like protein/PAS domain S-box-containing protein